jgi:uncharacterized metal-binding protein YceD (DUF177 family)
MGTNTSVNIYRTSVNLKEIGLEGESFHYTRKAGELNKRLADLIGNHDYSVNLTIRPMGNVFEISGDISTQMDLLCARCGRDAKEKIGEKFNEIILVLDERPRAGHSGHTGTTDEGPFCNYVTSYTFDLAEFVHEHIAAAEPYKPLCSEPDCEEVYKKAQILDTSPEIENNPFAVLKELSKRD